MGGIVDSVGDAIGGAADFVGDAIGGAADFAGDVAGTAAKVAAPVAAAYFAPMAGFGALGTAAVGAGLGGLASAATGGNFLQGALMGGIGGYMAAPAGGSGLLSAEQFGSLAGYPEAIQAYADAGMISPSMMNQATSAFTSLPAEAQQAYINAGYSPVEIGSALLSDSSGMLGSVKSGFDVAKTANQLFGTPQAANLLGTGAGMLGQYLGANQAKDAASTAALAQVEAAKIAAEAQKFKPIGVTTRFGASRFGYDPTGNLKSAGYQLAPDLEAQQNQLMGMAPGLLNQYAGAQAATAPMGVAGQRAMQLGQGYLATDPQAQAARYMSEQQGLLAPGRERDLATLQNRLMQQGRGGLATGGTSTMGAANPEMEAFYNAQRMQDLQLASQATQGGMDYAKFGTGLTGLGGDLMTGMYGAQQSAFAPYQTALGGAQSIENLGQSAMNLGTSLGSTTTNAAAAAGRLQQEGMLGAAKTMQPANAYSPWAGLFSGAGNALQGYGQPQYKWGV
jgi:hypothetical protein